MNGCERMPRKGDPSVITEATRSGRRAAAERDSMPPRLCPIRCTLRPVSSCASATVAMRRVTSKSRHSAFRPMRDRYGR